MRGVCPTAHVRVTHAETLRKGSYAFEEVAAAHNAEHKQQGSRAGDQVANRKADLEGHLGNLTSLCIRLHGTFLPKPPKSMRGSALRRGDICPMKIRRETAEGGRVPVVVVRAEMIKGAELQEKENARGAAQNSLSHDRNGGTLGRCGAAFT